MSTLAPAPVRRVPPHVTAAAFAPIGAALAVLAAVPWWPWEDGLLPLRVFLAAVYAAGAVTSVVLAVWLKGCPDPACLRQGVSR